MGNNTKVREGEGGWKWNCTQCQKEHECGVYVAAHWGETLIHTCDCGAKHELCRGFVDLIEEPTHEQ